LPITTGKSVGCAGFCDGSPFLPAATPFAPLLGEVAAAHDLTYG
jgi:hypothetical protein